MMLHKLSTFWLSSQVRKVSQREAAAAVTVAAMRGTGDPAAAIAVATLTLGTMNLVLLVSML